MGGEVVEAPLHEHVAGLQVASLLRQRRVVVVALPHVRRQVRRSLVCGGSKIFSGCTKYFSYLEESPGLLHPPLPHLEHAQVVVALGVVIVGRQGQLEALQIH